MIRDDTGQEIEDIFEYFEPMPIGAGMETLSWKYGGIALMESSFVGSGSSGKA